MSVAIRRATPNDAEVLAESRARIRIEHREPDADDLEAHRSAWLPWMRDALADGTYVGFIAYDGDAVAGSATLLIHAAIPRAGSRTAREGRVHSVYVYPAFRRSGVARALVSDVIAYARDAGLIRLRLRPTNMSRSLYASLGFAAEDEMALPLAP